ncbi:MAG TPA: DUF1015 domain-containing protein [Clostridiales bacterium]|nr:DUF1015 domain-containing protein [Clostridiales bacterium]
MPENKIGIAVPEILLPSSRVDMSKWAVVACDQYTSQPSYWNAVEEFVGDSPSTLHIIYPEVYLEADDKERRISSISQTMRRYLDEGVLKPIPPSFIYVERTLCTGVRRGLMAALDLEEYDYSEGSQSIIRATEGTVLDRLPPRIAIRQDAVLETPHIMVLIDDPEKIVIEPIAKNISEADKLYDFDLMMEGGHIAGYQVANPDEINRIIDALAKLADPRAFQNKYGVGEDKGVLLYAMGDGNHSFATAKACWDKIKERLSEDEIKNHPARFALVELVNVHDDSLVFEPIHRVLFNVDTRHVLKSMHSYYASTGQDFEYEAFDTKQEMELRFESLLSNSMCNERNTYNYAENPIENNKNVHLIPYMFAGGWGILKISRPKSNLEAGTLQAFLDEYLKENKNVGIDYIHGEDVTIELGSKAGNMGFLLPIMNKNDLFKTVIKDGVLPRKTFSMGEAHEKRFYLECRMIVK